MIPKGTPTGPEPAVQFQQVDQQTKQGAKEPKAGLSRSTLLQCRVHVIKDAKNAPGAGFGSDLLFLERELEYEKQQEYNTLNLKGGKAATKVEIKHAKNHRV